jgi:DNA-binding CsgD family transcriptional regulator
VLDVCTGATGTPILRPVLRGRDRELTLLLDRVVPPRRSDVVVVEGATGLGRTRLVEEVAATAAAAGVRVGVGRAWPGDDSVDMALLLDAVVGGPAPLVDPALLPGLPTRPDERYRLLREIACLLAGATRVAPVLVCLDDLHLADPGTLAALRRLPEELGGSPIGWLMTHRDGAAPPAVPATVDRLRQLGAPRVALRPLGEPDAAAVVADIVQAEPSPALLELAAGASGVPGLVVDLVSGLLEEGLVVVVAERAELVAPRLPRRLQERVRGRLDVMSRPATRLAGVAAVFGPGVTVDDLASVLGHRPTALFDSVDELVRADVLAGDGDGLTFCSELVRRVAAASVPAPLRRHLQRQAARLRGGVIAVPRRADADGRLDHRMRARRLAARACELAGAGHCAEADAVVGDAAAAVRVAGDREAGCVLGLARSQLSYMDGAYARAMHRLTAAGTPDWIVDGEHADVAAMWHSELLAVTDGLDAAITMAADAAAGGSPGRPAWVVQAWLALQGRHLLRAGRLTDASEVLREWTGPLDAAPATVPEAAALVARGRVALHTVDYATTRACATMAATMPAASAPEARRHASWLLALQAMATGDMVTAGRHLTPPGVGDHRLALPCLMIDPADAPQLMRLALATGDHRLARSVLAGADRRRALNPRVRTVAAAAVHTRGLCRSDAGALAIAATLLAGGGRPLPRASALEDLGRELVRRGDTDAAVRALGSALEVYAGVGAIWDVGRVRRRLRTLGVRRRLVHPPRPARDRTSLTAAELAVVRLVVQGLTNRAVAARLFVSPHTVSTHLRHVFAKLGVGSRVELTRMVLARDRRGRGSGVDGCDLPPAARP